MGVNAESGLNSDFCRRTCGSKKALARARKSLRLPIRNERRISRIVTGLGSGVQNFSRYLPNLAVLSTGQQILPPRVSGPAEDQPVHAVAHVTQVGLIAFFQFRHGAAAVSDFSEGLAHCHPVYIAVAEINPGVSVFPTLEIFEMDLHDPLAQRS